MDVAFDYFQNLFKAKGDNNPAEIVSVNGTPQLDPEANREGIHVIKQKFLCFQWMSTQLWNQ
jgi:hypothetical protein